MAKTTFHQPVLKSEVIELLAPKPKDICVDMTLGGGGHAEAIMQRLGGSGKLIGLDLDDEALSEARQRLSRFGSEISLLRENFADIDRVMKDMGVTPNVLIFDLGLSSHQIESPERGFSFSKVGPLDMRMDTRQKETAWALLENLPVKELARIIRDYGEEPKAGRIAKRIGWLRDQGKTPKTTAELRQIIESVVPRSGRRRIHPATRTFMAFRIAVNNELENLETALLRALDVLAPGGRIGVISYHSLEDRIVKRFFAQKAKGCTCPPSAPQCICGNMPELKILTRKPIRPSESEIERNPRARSAKLRVAEKLRIN